MPSWRLANKKKVEPSGVFEKTKFMFSNRTCLRVVVGRCAFQTIYFHVLPNKGVDEVL
jgi:hypothetical protein